MSFVNELIWLHISDIHFHPKVDWRDNIARRELICFLKESFENKKLPKPNLIFCTGDIAFGETRNFSMEQQYSSAIEFFDELLRCCSLNRDRLFMVPGNHDVDRSEILGDQQSRLIEMAKNSREHVNEINSRFSQVGKDHKLAMERLQKYGKFVKEYRADLFNEKHHAFAKKIDINGWKVGVGGFNSAWSCSGPEDDRHVWLGAEWQFNFMASELGDSDIKIGLIHHPFDWLDEAEQHFSERRASKEFHFFLHGHTHTAWVRPSENCIQIAAGAVGADTPDQFGINLTQLNPVSGECCAHLYTYNQGWVISPVAQHAPEGNWYFKSCLNLNNKIEPSNPVMIFGGSDEVIGGESRPTNDLLTKSSIFGRDKLIRHLSSVLVEKKALAIYGMRGNGKSVLIRALLEKEPLNKLGLLHITVSSETTPGELFRHLINLLNDHSESPTVPDGTLSSQVISLQKRYQNVRAACIWVDRAHLLIEGKQWKNPQVYTLLVALRKAFPSWRWIFELRERPEIGSFGADCHFEEILGLDRKSLMEFIKANAPEGQEVAWTYSGEKQHALYQWLGGGHGQQAHPLATRLLIEVANGKTQSPWQVYQNMRQEVLGKVEEALLGELYTKVLATHERNLLQALALYRVGIPHDHADWLEEALGAEGSWQALERRCLLPVDPEGQRYYLHGFISSWICREHLHTTEVDEGQSQDLLSGNSEVPNLHLQIGRCWQRQLGNTRRLSSINIERANEACHHLLNAGATDAMGEWLENLVRGQAGWSEEKLWELEKKMHHRRAPLDAMINVLKLLIRLYPGDPRSWSFLGEALQKTIGVGCNEALRCFEEALELSPGNPRNLANLGTVLRERGKSGAEDFLHRLVEHRRLYPESINDYVLIIEASCLQASGQNENASAQRYEHIKNKVINAVFYNDEAVYQLIVKKNPDEALRILDLAEKNNCANSHTVTIRCRIFDSCGSGHLASELRQEQIECESADAIFYVEEAKYQFSVCKDKENALRIIDLMDQRGYGNIFGNTLRRKIQRSNHKF